MKKAGNAKWIRFYVLWSQPRVQNFIAGSRPSSRRVLDRSGDS
jgi:hypothetical protein